MLQNNVYRTIRERTFAGRDPDSTFAGRDDTASDNSNCNYNHTARKKSRACGCWQIRLRVVSNFDDGDCGVDEIHTRARNFEETRREGSAKSIGKLVAERTRMAREQQKKAAAEAAIIIANNKARATTAAPEPATTTEDESPKIAVSAPPNGLLLAA